MLIPLGLKVYHTCSRHILEHLNGVLELPISLRVESLTQIQLSTQIVL